MLQNANLLETRNKSCKKFVKQKGKAAGGGGGWNPGVTKYENSDYIKSTE